MKNKILMVFGWAWKQVVTRPIPRDIGTEYTTSELFSEDPSVYVHVIALFGQRQCIPNQHHI